MSIFKDCRDMSRDANSESESKNSPNEHDDRRPLTDCQLFGTFIFCVIAIIFATYTGCWLGKFTALVFVID